MSAIAASRLSALRGQPETSTQFVKRSNRSIESRLAQAEGAPYCAAPDGDLRSPGESMGALSCDTHAHICGPGAEFSYADERIYTPPDALAEDYFKLLSVLGVERSVLVQPSVYGTDNVVMLRAMAALSRLGIECRGVAVVDEAITDDALDSMHDAGVRGIRFNLVDVADPKKGAPLERVRSLCERIAPRRWHAEFLIHVDQYPVLDEVMEDFPTDIVIGHIGYVRPGSDEACEGFRAMLRLAKSGKCWIKLTGPYRISSGNQPYAEAGRYARAAVEAAPERILWGTDWPHVMVTKEMPNDADLCELLYEWVPGAETRRMILVDNPEELYEF